MERMPAKRIGILSLVCRIPVNVPAIAPPPIAAKQAKKGSPPSEMIRAAIAAPSGNTPSQDKSAISRILKVKKTPIANIAHRIPNDIALISISSTIPSVFLNQV